METCDGDCPNLSGQECVPPIQRVAIRDDRKWGGTEFDYCQVAIQKDQEKGFTVEQVDG